MMIKSSLNSYVIIFILYLCVAFPFNSTAQIIWQNSLGGSNTDNGRDIIQTIDDGYITVGRTLSNDGDVWGFNGTRDSWVVKLDANGDTTWTRSFGGSQNEHAKSVWQTQDSGYVVASNALSNDGDVWGVSGGFDYWVVKLNANGDTIWTNALGGSAYDLPGAVQQTDDGGYIIGGVSASGNGDSPVNYGGRDFWTVKLDSTGKLSWQKVLGGSNQDQHADMIQTIDGGYIMTGSVESNDGYISGNHGAKDAWSVKLNSVGDTVWTSTLGGSDRDGGRSIQQTDDGGYIFAGLTSSNDGDVHGHHGDRDVWVVKLNTTGDTIWTNALGGTNEEYANSVQQTNDGGYIVAGLTESNNGDVWGKNSGYDYWLVKLNCTGDTVWTKTLGGPGNDKAGSVQQTNDGSYVLTGSSTSDSLGVSGNHGQEDYWVVKYQPPSNNQPTRSTNTTLSSFNDVCQSDTSFQLTSGSPAGGTYAGPGITNGSFDPSTAGPGTHTISYMVSGFKDSLAVYYTFDSITGNTVHDATGNYDGSNSGGTTGINGQIGDGINFDTTQQDYVEINNGPIGLGDDHKSFAAWIKPNNQHNDQIFLLGNAMEQPGVGNNPDQDHWRFFVNPGTNDMGLQGKEDGVQIVEEVTYYCGFNTSQWYHVAFTASRSFPAGKKIRLYVNGRHIGSVSDSVPREETDAYRLMAKWKSQTNQWIYRNTCNMDEVGLWSRALTDQEIQCLYNNGSGVQYPYPNSSDTAQSTITVHPQPTVTATSDTAICNGQSVQLQAAGAPSYSWSSPAGLSCSNCPQPVATPSQDMTYTVTGTDANGCTNSDSVQITVNTSPDANIATANVPSSVCAKAAVSFTDSSTGPVTQYTWIRNGTVLSNNQNTSIPFPNSGTDTISLAVSTAGNCTDTASLTIDVLPKPSAAFTADTACLGQTTTFTDQSGSFAQSWQWYFGDGDSSSVQNPTHTYSNAGSYNGELIVSNANGCRDTAQNQVVVNSRPQAAFSSNSPICTHDTLQLTDNSSTNNGTITSHTWSFGDGDSSQQVSPSHHYTSPGSYEVELTVVDAAGCQSSYSDSITIQPTPNAQLGPKTSICYGDSIQLAASGGNYYNWATISTANPTISNPVVSPQNTSTYAVTVTNNNGCQANDSTTITVVPDITIQSLQDTSICQGDTAQLSIAGANSYVWISGATQDTVSQSASASVSPQQSTDYYVMSFDSVCQRTDTVSVTVHSTPSTQIVPNGPASICNGEQVTLTAQPSGADYSWSTGSNSQSITVSSQGQYAVTVTNANNCSAGADTTVAILAVPEADFQVNPVCEGETTQFTDQSDGQGGTLSSWSWSFGDNAIDTAASPQHTYASSGNYDVLLEVKNANGCGDTIQKEATVYSLPEPSFEVSGQCAGERLTFTAANEGAGASVSTWQWAFGDGDSTSGSTVNHTYDSAATYNVTLSATDNNQCSNSYRETRTINEQPVAQIGIQDTDNVFGLGEEIRLLNESVNYTDWQWFFDDGNRSTTREPLYVYTDSGTYQVTLQVSNQYNCEDTDTVALELIPLEEVYAGNAFSPNGDRTNDVFLAKGRGIQEFTMRIYNRWGELVFETDDMKEGWDGYYKGELQEADTYMYEIEAVGYSGKVITKSGHFVLIR